MSYLMKDINKATDWHHLNLVYPLSKSLKDWSEQRIGYLDDISMAGSNKTVSAEAVLLVEATSKLGLKLNASKCELIVDDCSITRTMKIFDGFRETSPHELTLLGAPILKGKAVDEALKKKVKELERAIFRLALLHFHDALCRLRNSISTPKLLFCSTYVELLHTISSHSIR